MADANAHRDWYVCNSLLPQPSKSMAFSVGMGHQLAEFNLQGSVIVAGAAINCTSGCVLLDVLVDSGLSGYRRVGYSSITCTFDAAAGIS